MLKKKPTILGEFDLIPNLTQLIPIEYMPRGK